MKLFFKHEQGQVVIIKVNNNNITLAGRNTDYKDIQLERLIPSWDEQQLKDYYAMKEKLINMSEEEKKEYAITELKKLGFKFVKAET